MKVYRLWDKTKQEYVSTGRRRTIWVNLTPVKGMRTRRGKDRFEVHTFILVRDTDTFRVILESVLGTDGEYNDLAKEILDA